MIFEYFLEPKIAEVVGDDEQDGAGNVGADAPITDGDLCASVMVP